jgi:hypothetical protein
MGRRGVSAAYPRGHARRGSRRDSRGIGERWKLLQKTPFWYWAGSADELPRVTKSVNCIGVGGAVQAELFMEDRDEFRVKCTHDRNLNIVTQCIVSMPPNASDRHPGTIMKPVR